MNMMKKIVNLSLALALVIGTAAWAQPEGGRREDGRRGGGDPAERAERLTASMTDLLALTEEQQNEVGDLNLEYAMKMKETRDENEGDWEAMRGAMMELNQEKEEKLATVLSEEQMQLYQEKKKEFIRKAREHRGKRKGKGKKDSTSQ